MALFSQNRWLKITVRLALFFRASGSLVSEFTAVERFGERVLEGGDLYESHLRFLADNRRYEKNGSPNLNEQREWMNNMSCMKIELDGKVDLESNSNIIVERWNQII